MTLMLGRMEDDEFVPLTVTDTAGGRRLVQVGWLNDRGWFISFHDDYGPADLDRIERMGYTIPVFREAE